MSSTTAAPPRRRPAAPARGSVTAPRTRPRPPVRTPDPARRAPAPARRVVAPAPARVRRRPRLRITVLVLGVAVVVITIAGFHAFLAQTQVRLEQLRGRTATAEARYETARLQNGQLASPARITTRAAELGLGPTAVAPVAIPLSGAVPQRGGASETLTDWAEVKGHLDSAP